MAGKSYEPLAASQFKNRRFSSRYGMLTVDRALLSLAILALISGLVARLTGETALPGLLWMAGLVPILAVLIVRCARDLLHGDTGVDLIAALAMAGALALGEHLAGIVIAVMYAGGTVLEQFAIGRAERELTALLGCVPRVAHRDVGETIEDMAVEEVRRGDRLLVKSGEVVPVDGEVLDETAVLDEKTLSGESRPVRRRRAERVRSGAVNADRAFRMLAIATAADSTYAAIVRLVNQARRSKAPFVRLADRYALIFLPCTLLIAGAAWLASGDPTRALAVLVVATPCPLILAAPVAITAGISAAARRGVIFKGGAPLETLANIRTLLFDKTGTLTTGQAKLVGIETYGAMSPDEVLTLAASLDQLSQQVTAEVIVAVGRERGLTLELPRDVAESHGEGIEGTLGQRRVRLGGQRYALGAQASAWAERVRRAAEQEGSFAVFVAVDGQPAGALVLADEIRRDTPRTLRLLRSLGIRRMVMVSGDRLEVAQAVAAAAGIDTVLADRSPVDKIEAVHVERAAAPTGMVGDGVNDAPALAAADVGIAMAARSGSAAGEAADVVIVVDRLDRLVEAVSIARRSRAIARQSVIAGMSLSVLGMLAAAAGFLTPVAGALVQEAIDVVVILNALRALGQRPVPRHLSTLGTGEWQRIEGEHAALEILATRLRELAERLRPGTDATREELAALQTLLRTQLLPHEQWDEAVLHPRLAPALGGRDPFAAVSHGHRELHHLVRLYDRLLARLPPGPLDRSVLPELQRTLFSLAAVLRLHIAEEQEIYDNVQALPDRYRERPAGQWTAQNLELGGDARRGVQG